MTHKHTFGLLAVAIGLLTLNGCYYERSGSTGWAYNFPENGGLNAPHTSSKKLGLDSSLWKVEPSRWVKSTTI